MSQGRGNLVRAHRISWELHRGPIPEGQHVLHRCDNPGCVNPDHLFLGTPATNQQDCIAKGRYRCGRKLTDSAIIAIRKARAVGITVKDLMKTHDVDRKTIYNVIHHRTWKHVI